MAAAIEVTDNRDGTVLHETIPDVDQLRPWTWMELRLQPLPDGIHDVKSPGTLHDYKSLNNPSRSSSNPPIQASSTSFDLSGRPVVSLPPGIVITRRPDGTIHKLWNTRKH